MVFAFQFLLRLLAHKVGVDALALDEIKGPLQPYKSDHIRSFWVHLVNMAYSMIP
jgi:hypothetical protein